MTNHCYFQYFSLDIDIDVLISTDISSISLLILILMFWYPLIHWSTATTAISVRGGGRQYKCQLILTLHFPTKLAGPRLGLSSRAQWSQSVSQERFNWLIVDNLSWGNILDTNTNIHTYTFIPYLYIHQIYTEISTESMCSRNNQICPVNQ